MILRRTASLSQHPSMKGQWQRASRSVATSTKVRWWLRGQKSSISAEKTKLNVTNAWPTTTCSSTGQEQRLTATRKTPAGDRQPGCLSHSVLPAQSLQKTLLPLCSNLRLNLLMVGSSRSMSFRRSFHKRPNIFFPASDWSSTKTDKNTCDLLWT